MYANVAIRGGRQHRQVNSRCFAAIFVFRMHGASNAAGGPAGDLANQQQYEIQACETKHGKSRTGMMIPN